MFAREGVTRKAVPRPYCSLLFSIVLYCSVWLSRTPEEPAWNFRLFRGRSQAASAGQRYVFRKLGPVCSHFPYYIYLMYILDSAWARPELLASGIPPITD